MLKNLSKKSEFFISYICRFNLFYVKNKIRVNENHLHRPELH